MVGEVLSSHGIESRSMCHVSQRKKAAREGRREIRL